MAEQLSLDFLEVDRRGRYRELLGRALTAGVPRSWLAETLWDLHVWVPNCPAHVLERELALLADRAGIDFAGSSLAEDSSAARRLAPSFRDGGPQRVVVHPSDNRATVQHPDR